MPDPDESHNFPGGGDDAPFDKDGRKIPERYPELKEEVDQAGIPVLDELVSTDEFEDKIPVLDEIVDPDATGKAE